MKTLSTAILTFIVCITITIGCGGGGGGSDNSKKDTGGSEGFTLSGTIRAMDKTAADSDVNDPFAPYAPNDIPADAKPVTTPSMVGGYVNQSGQGAEGRSFENGDTDDYYSATIPAGQTIVLYIADISDADLDLSLYSAQAPETPIATSHGTGLIESITVDETGDYLIRISAFDGASNYTMVIGGAGSVNALTYLGVKDDFVPGEAIVRFADTQQQNTTDQGFAVWARNTGLLTNTDIRDAPTLLQFSHSGRKAALFEKLGLSKSRSMQRNLDDLSEDKTAAVDTLQIIAALNRQPDVVYAEPNYIRKLLLTPDDSFYDLQWHYPLIDLPKAWDETTGSSNVVVAVIDSGVLSGHPDLVGKLTDDGYDFVRDVPGVIDPLDGDGPDDNPEDPGVNDLPNGGSTFHGTHVAGTIGAATNNAVGVAGVGWSTMVMPLRVFGNAADSWGILQALRYAAGMENESGVLPNQPADIINLSFGGYTASQVEADLFHRIINDRHIVVVAAAGNDASDQPHYPASYPGVISVSAVDLNQNPAPYSNYGKDISLAAPGGVSDEDLNGDSYVDGVLSTGGDDTSGDSIQYTLPFRQGTSMAAPHVAGVIALMKAVKSDLTPSDVQGWLAAGSLTTDLGPPGRDDQFGYGLINAYKAVMAAKDGHVPTSLSVKPNELNLGNRLTSAKLWAEKLGDEALHIVSVNATADWLSIDASETDGAGLGAYTATVNMDDPSISEPGAYHAEIEFNSTKNSVAVAVNLQVTDNNSQMPGDAGFHYVLLMDPQNYEGKYQVKVPADQGVYAFTFKDVAPGEYVIFAGTDSDNDYFVGDPGEAMGAYTTIEQPTAIVVSKDLTGLDFTTGYRLNLPSYLSADDGLPPRGIRLLPH